MQITPCAPRRLVLSRVLPVLLAAVSMPAALAAGAAPQTQKHVEGGIAIELAVEPLEGNSGQLVEGTPARVRLKIADANTGAPLAGLFPGAWMDLLPPPATAAAGGEAPAPGCRDKVEAFVGGSLLTRPEVDLNTYYVLALNEEPTISVVDPLFGFGSSKLLAMVFLASPGEDWALSSDESRLFVSLPKVDRVAVVETDSWKVVTELATGPRPRRLALQPDGQYLWATYEGSAGHPPGVAVFNALTLEKAADFPLGHGPHDLAFSGDSRLAFIAAAAGGVSVFDAARLVRRGEVPTGERPVAIAWSEAARAAYVSHAGDGTIAVVRAEGEAAPAVAARLTAEPGLGRIRFAPGGRLGFVVQPGKNRLHVLDAASNRIVQTAEVEAEPDDVAFSAELAYVRHRGSETVLMVPLAALGGEGRPVPLVDFPGGQHPPGAEAATAPGIVGAPGAAAVLVANPLDKAIYFYKEGMAAPMGHFQNYGRQPRAVLVVDRTLREAAPGTYETMARLGPAGRYELALLLDAPRLIHCFPVRVEEDAALAAQRARRTLDVKMLAAGSGSPGSGSPGTGGPGNGGEEIVAGEPVRIRVQLRDPASGALRTGLGDVRVLTFLSPGIWQQRLWAEERADGDYEVAFTPPEPGAYYVFVEAASAALPLQKSPPLTLDVKARAQKATDPATSEVAGEKP